MMPSVYLIQRQEFGVKNTHGHDDEPEQQSGVSQEKRQEHFVALRGPNAE